MLCKAGWLNIFSREPVLTPDDLRRLRIASNAEAEQMNNVFRAMGFNIIDVDWTDVGPRINSGDISAVYMIPPVIAAFRMDDILKHKLTLPIAPVIGGIVINRVTWDRIRPEDQRAMTSITRRIVAELEAGMPQTNNNALSVMSQRGMQFNQPTSAQEQLWENDIQRVMPNLVGTAFDRDLLEVINRVLANHRSNQ
jgi:TRAP-type C4-dicarboxylate transport system substrate-binding protein